MTSPGRDRPFVDPGAGQARRQPTASKGPRMNEPEVQGKAGASADDAAWATATAGLALRATQARADRVLRLVTLVHGGSALVLVPGAIALVANDRASPIIAVLMAGAALWAAVSAGAGWLMRTVPLALPLTASLVVIVPLCIAGWWTSLVLWANVLAIGLVYLAHRARVAAAP
jgi:hypothetical protein